MIDDSAIAKYGPGTSQAINLIVDKVFLLQLIWFDLKMRNGNDNIFLPPEKEVDGSGVGMIITPERKEKMDFAYLIWTEPYTIVSPRPGEEPRVFSFVWPFQANVSYLNFRLESISKQFISNLKTKQGVATDSSQYDCGGVFDDSFLVDLQRASSKFIRPSPTRRKDNKWTENDLRQRRSIRHFRHQYDD